MRAVLATLVILAGCGDDHPTDAPAHDAALDAAGGPDADPARPGTLAETGLCVDDACAEIAPDVVEFAPEYALWSDGAAKRRWIRLPDGAAIDSADMDYWVFPAGTQLWKEFTRDGTRVETRLLQKNGPEERDWYMVAFAWNPAQDQATAVPTGATDWLDTDHDIPSQSDCRKCHENSANRVLGFQAILLDHDGAGLTLDALVNDPDRAWLTVEPTPGAGGDYFPIPGGPEAQAALGYLHTNCGNCHNPGSSVHDMTPLEWRLTVATLGDVATTPPYLTAIDVPPVSGPYPPEATAIIEPGAPAASWAFLRMESTQSSAMMPPQGRELVDGAGLAVVQAWIDSL